MPRPRTARIPLVRSSASRTERARSRERKPARARLVAFALVLVSLALVTVYFRESSDGALHGAQRIGISVLAPFEIAGERVAQPFQDAYGWTTDVLSAKDENEKLEKEVRELRQQVIINADRGRGERELPRAAQVPRRAALPEGLPRRRDARVRRAADGLPPGRARRRRLERRHRGRRSGRPSAGPRRHRDRGRAERVEGAPAHRPAQRRLGVRARRPVRPASCCAA